MWPWGWLNRRDRASTRIDKEGCVYEMRMVLCLGKYGRRIFVVAIASLLLVLLGGMTCSSAVYGAEKAVSSRTIAILSVEGDDAKVNKGGKKSIKAVPGMKMGKGYMISTGKNTTLYFQVDDDKAIKLSPSASVVISEASKKKLSITLKSGELFFNVKKPVAEGATVEFNAGGTSMGIRGTVGFLRLREEEAIFGLANGRSVLDTGEETMPLEAMEECMLVHAQKDRKLPMQIEKTTLNLKDETIFVRESILENNDHLDVISEEELEEYKKELEEDKEEAKQEQAEEAKEEEEDEISEEEQINPAPNMVDSEEGESAGEVDTEDTAKDADHGSDSSGGSGDADSGGGSGGSGDSDSGGSSGGSDSGGNSGDADSDADPGDSDSGDPSDGGDE